MRTFLCALLAAGCGTEVDGVSADAAPRADAVPVVDGGGDGSDGGGGDGGGGVDAMPALVDLDLDGLDDAAELAMSAAYLPFLSLHPGDGCTLGGIVVRVRPHPDDTTRVHIIYDHLFQNDCGLGGHVGDNEVFAVTVDPSLPPPAGIRAIRAISHQGTLCERTSNCGACGGGMAACSTAMIGGQAWPVVYSSQDKHASYVELGTCNPITACGDTCMLAAASDAPPLANAGEPEAHLVENLTTQGFITAANGWTEASLMNFNPWDTGTDFGTAGNVAGDLVDPAFLTPLCP